jgi:hypothetical protein
MRIVNRCTIALLPVLLATSHALFAQPPTAAHGDLSGLPPAECLPPTAAPGPEGWNTPAADHWLGLRTSLTHPRAIGLGQPLQGTSWLNRPYEFSLETGALIMANDPGDGSSKANDLLAAAQLGWDFDHYWGSQVRIAWSSPNYNTDVAPTSDSSNDLVIYDASLLYYPWGDSRVRPYYRFGVGLTDIDFVDIAGNSTSETLFTVPLGIGIKYQKERWMALRFEATDNIAFAQGGSNTLNNFTLTFGAEWRFGGRPAPGWRRDGSRNLQ